MPDRLSEIRAREQAATPGPWEHKLDPAWNENDRIVENPSGFVILRDENCHRHFKQGRDEANYEFIARARADIPFLLAEVERLTAELVEARKDTARLDWLEQHGTYGGNGEVSTEKCDYFRKTLREAIDAAMEDK